MGTRTSRRHTHDVTCVVLDGRRPRCRVSGSLIGDWWKRPMMERGRQVTCVHGLKVFLVDGSYLRNNHDSDFVQGGNGFRYPRFCSRRELWVEEAIPEVERPYVLFHECYETEKMRQGWSYERAHDAAKRAENKLRRRDRPGE